MATKREGSRARSMARRAKARTDAPPEASAAAPRLYGFESNPRGENPPSRRPLTRHQVAARLTRLNCDPLKILARLAKNTSLDPLLRAALARHLAAYQIDPAAVATAADSAKDLPTLGDVIASAWRKPRARPKAAAPVMVNAVKANAGHKPGATQKPGRAKR